MVSQTLGTTQVIAIIAWLVDDDDDFEESPLMPF